MMGRKFAFLAVGAAALLSLTGCRGGAAQPKDPPSAVSTASTESGIAGAAASEDCDGFIENGLRFLEEFQKGQFDAFYQRASAEFSGQVPKETFAAQWAAILQGAGRQEEILSSERVETDGYQLVTITARHVLRKLETSFAYADESTVAGVSFRFLPLDVTAESSDVWQEVPVRVGAGERQLQGLLTLPEGVENPPVALLVQGSGPSDLDEKIGGGGNRPFRDLAHGLAERGIASLRYNKRSYEFPEDCANSGIEAEYLDDVQAAVRLLFADGRVDGNRIYLLGHSEGGMLGPELIRRNPEIAGFVSLAGSLRPLPDLLLEQVERQLAGQPSLTAEQREAAIAPYRQAVEQIKALSPGEESPAILGAPAVYWIGLNELDLPALAAELTVPVLVLQGEEDFQVPAGTDLPIWREALAGNPDASFKLYPGLSHLFMPGGKADTIDPSVYDVPAAVDSQVIADIADWILAH